MVRIMKLLFDNETNFNLYLSNIEINKKTNDDLETTRRDFFKNVAY